MEINNNYSAQNFGMALKIRKGGKEFLTQQSEKVLTRLGEIGEEMKDYKHWDLVVTEKGYEATEKVSIPRSYASSVHIDTDSTTNKYYNNRIQFDTYVGGSYANKGAKATPTFEDLDPSEVEAVKNKFILHKFDFLEKFAEFVRFLEKRSAEKAAEEAARRAQEARINELVDDLASKFSFDA